MAPIGEFVPSPIRCSVVFRKPERLHDMHTSPTPQAYARWRPLPLRGAQFLGGFWGERQAVNRASVLHGHRMLEKSGTLNNFRLASGAARGEGTFQGFVFQDSDAHKWLEALALTLALGPDAELEALADETIALLASAQQPDGYLNSHFTVAKPGERWTDLEWEIGRASCRERV